MRSIKSKLIFGVSLLVIVLLVASAFLQVREKEKELIGDIFNEARSYAELTAPTLVENYKLYLVPKSFVYFNRELASLLSKNEDIEAIKIADFSGEILFDSQEEKSSQYEGQTRLIDDQQLVEQIKSPNLSVVTESGKVVFYKKVADESGNLVKFESVDSNEKPIDDLLRDTKIKYFVQPVSSEYAVIYDVTYQALSARILVTQMRIMLLAIMGIFLGLGFSLFFAARITNPIKVLKEGAEILAKGDFSHRVDVKSKDEIELLANTFNKMAADLEESTKALVYKERVAKELEIAQQIQRQIIPKNIPQISGIDLSAGIIPAEEIGGDCYDFLPLDEKNMLFYLGDVTGHGVPSGIVVSIANALFYTLASSHDLNEILVQVNNVLKEKTTANMFLTLVLMKWMAEKNKFSYVSAGHEQIIHYRAETGEAELLPSGGLALGMIKEIGKTLKVREVDLKSGDALIIYSDGIPEAWRGPGEMYGMERFLKVAKEYGSFETALAIRNALLSDVYIYRQGYKQMDDITCIVLKKT